MPINNIDDITPQNIGSLSAAIEAAPVLAQYLNEDENLRKIGGALEKIYPLLNKLQRFSLVSIFNPINEYNITALYATVKDLSDNARIFRRELIVCKVFPENKDRVKKLIEKLDVIESFILKLCKTPEEVFSILRYIPKLDIVTLRLERLEASISGIIGAAKVFLAWKISLTDKNKAETPEELNNILVNKLLNNKKLEQITSTSTLTTYGTMIAEAYRITQNDFLAKLLEAVRNRVFNIQQIYDTEDDQYKSCQAFLDFYEQEKKKYSETKELNTQSIADAPEKDNTISECVKDFIRIGKILENDIKGIELYLDEISKNLENLYSIGMHAILKPLSDAFMRLDIFLIKFEVSQQSADSRKKIKNNFNQLTLILEQIATITSQSNLKAIDKDNSSMESEETQKIFTDLMTANKKNIAFIITFWIWKSLIATNKKIFNLCGKISDHYNFEECPRAARLVLHCHLNIYESATAILNGNSELKYPDMINELNSNLNDINQCLLKLEKPKDNIANNEKPETEPNESNIFFNAHNQRERINASEKDKISALDKSKNHTIPALYSIFALCFMIDLICFAADLIADGDESHWLSDILRCSWFEDHQQDTKGSAATGTIIGFTLGSGLSLMYGLCRAVTKPRIS